MARARLPFLLRALPLLLLVLAAPSIALTYVPMTDGELADAAAVIAVVRVDAVGLSPAGARPATHYQASILRLLKGSPAGSSIVVRVPGGERPDGPSLWVPGAPRFRPGDQPLLFLAARAGGTYAVLGLFLGAFPTTECYGVDGGGLVRALKEVRGEPVAKPQAAIRSSRRWSKQCW